MTAPLLALLGARAAAPAAPRSASASGTSGPAPSGSTPAGRDTAFATLFTRLLDATPTAPVGDDPVDPLAAPPASRPVAVPADGLPGERDADSEPVPPARVDPREPGGHGGPATAVVPAPPLAAPPDTSADAGGEIGTPESRPTARPPDPPGHGAEGTAPRALEHADPGAGVHAATGAVEQTGRGTVGEAGSSAAVTVSAGPPAAPADPAAGPAPSHTAQGATGPAADVDVPPGTAPSVALVTRGQAPQGPVAPAAPGLAPPPPAEEPVTHAARVPDDPVTRPAPPRADAGGGPPPVAPAGGTPPSGDAAPQGEAAPTRLAQRIADAVELLEHAPPPRRLTLELGELRLAVSLRGDSVRVTFLAGQPNSGELARELSQALAARGLHLGGFGQEGAASAHEQSGRGDARDRPQHPSPDAPPLRRRRAPLRPAGPGVQL